MKFDVEYQNPKGALITETVEADDQIVQRDVVQFVRDGSSEGAPLSENQAVFSVPADRLVVAKPAEDECSCQK